MGDEIPKNNGQTFNELQRKLVFPIVKQAKVSFILKMLKDFSGVKHDFQQTNEIRQRIMSDGAGDSLQWVKDSKVNFNSLR